MDNYVPIGLVALYKYVSGLAGLQLACITGAGGGGAGVDKIRKKKGRGEEREHLQ